MATGTDIRSDFLGLLLLSSSLRLELCAETSKKNSHVKGTLSRVMSHFLRCTKSPLN